MPTTILTERDESGFVTATATSDGVVTTKQRTGGPRDTARSLVGVFLPAGYPASVSEDYIG